MNPTINLSRIIEGWAAHFPSKVALHFHGLDFTYQDLWNRIQNASNSLQVHKGDRVAWLGYNSPELLVLLFALARLGADLVFQAHGASWRMQ